MRREQSLNSMVLPSMTASCRSMRPAQDRYEVREVGGAVEAADVGSNSFGKFRIAELELPSVC